ncbi:MAG: hypothetical protein RLZZ209_706, partial [Bacteroidota bacterium]
EIEVYINKYREKHQSPPITWDGTIAQFSQNWANYLSSKDLFQHSNNSMYGENLAYFSGYNIDTLSLLKKAVDLPIHLHTHDTASVQSATYLKAIEAGVDIVDGALGAMSGLTSQPNLNSLVAMMQGHKKASDLDLDLLNEYSNYWEAVRTMYAPFESELKAGTAEVYNNEIPGGQYTNLRGQAIALGVARWTIYELAWPGDCLRCG